MIEPEHFVGGMDTVRVLSLERIAEEPWPEAMGISLTKILSHRSSRGRAGKRRAQMEDRQIVDRSWNGSFHMILLRNTQKKIRLSKLRVLFVSHMLTPCVLFQPNELGPSAWNREKRHDALMAKE